MSEEKEDTNVKVAVRCRPLNSKEKGQNEGNCIRISSDQLVITNPSTGEDHNFGFDLIFDHDSLQSSVWDSIGVPILNKAFSGYNGTIFAYGQTGSGKTWSMQGIEGNQGIIPNMNNALFERIAAERATRHSVQFLVTVSYFEIYNEVIFDLLDSSDRKKQKQQVTKGGLEIKEHPVLGVYVKGLQEIVVDSPEKLQYYINQGMMNRTVASTQMNADSSRSHSVFQITVHQKDVEDETKNVFAKVNLVDLAGSERVKSTGASGATLKEGANINKSLSALGNVINALVEQAKGKRTFVPYRNSKLTRVLQESLGGNSVTAMLAALSPAACNFEETLSTLKYANRAKSIKVNAVKNEEASQISKLNEEIRLLREKLQNQPSNVDAEEAFEERHRQQLVELEEAKRSTWEAKAKMSEDYERERKRLEMEQKKSARQLEASKEKNWRLLEEKEDLDLSLMHLKDLVKQSPDLLVVVADWQKSLQAVIKMERKVAEQYTMVQVYRNALQKESVLVVGPQTDSSFASLSASMKLRRGASNLGNIATVPHDKATLSQWRQICDKLTSIKQEIERWMEMQHTLSKSIDSFTVLAQDKLIELRSVEEMAGDNPEMKPEVKAKFREIIRGIQLISRQLAAKRVACESNMVSTRKSSVTFDSFGSDLISSLQQYSYALKTCEFPPGMQKDSSQVFANLSQGEISLAQVLSSGFDKFASTEPGSASFFRRALTSSQYSLELSSEGTRDSDPAKLSSSESSSAYIDSQHCWSVASECLTSSLLDIELLEPGKVVGLQLQGGVRRDSLNGTIDKQKNQNYKEITLPSGLSLGSLDGDNIELTQRAIADTIDWAVLLKKASPEKFLKRPPVRFLFDLFKYCCSNGPAGLLWPTAVKTTEWDLIADSKQAKMEFMDHIIHFISKTLSLPPVVTSHSIVTGAETSNTNALLQQLAVVMYASSKQSDYTRSSPTRELIEVATLCWPSEVRLLFSTDGEIWSREMVVTTNLQNGTDVVTLTCGGGVETKYIRMYQTKSDFPVSALRVGVVVMDEVAESQQPQTETGDDRMVKLGEAVLKTLITYQSSAGAVISAIDFLVSAEEEKKLLKQEEAKKQMEGLANEKLALEQMLKQEKQLLNNEKQDLSEQLRIAREQLEEARALLSKEQEMKQRIEEEYNQLDSEKNEIQSLLQVKIDEETQLKGELLNLRAIYEKDKILIETMTVKTQEQEDQLSKLLEDLEEERTRGQASEADREDLMNQIAILTEERDAARTCEENLFIELNERTIDLEKLQESYVLMSDRCNDAQDELSDLREQLQSYEATLHNHLSAGSMHLSSVGSSYKEKEKPSTSFLEAESRVEQCESPPPPAPTPAAALKKTEEEESDRDGNAKPGVNNNAYDDDFDDYEDEFENE